MGTFVFDNAHGRAVEWYLQAIGATSPVTSGSNDGILALPVNRTSDTDTLMRARVTLADLLGGLTDEPTNTVGGDGLRRKVLTASGSGEYLLPASVYDTTNHWWPLDTSDLLWHAPSSGGAWTDLIWGYIPNITSYADSSVYLMVCQSFGFSPDGTGDALATIVDFFRALRNG